MFGIILSILIICFGFFLKATDNPGFATSKKMAWMLIILGVVTLAGRLFIMYNKGQL